MRAVNWRAIPDVPETFRTGIRTMLKDERPNIMFRNYERMCKDLAERTKQNEELFYDKNRIAVRAHDVSGGPSEIVRPFAYTPEYTKAYTAFRMLSSFSITRRLLRDLAQNRPEFTPETILDFGAGPGTTLWAVEDIWPGAIQKCLNVEPSESMIEAGNHLMGFGPFDEERILVQWCSSITEPSVRKRKFSLVIAANVMGELPSDKARLAALQLMWNFVDPEGGELLLIEPATKWGFRTISTAREILADPENYDVEIEAPCTHSKTCPMTVSEMNPRKMWCQFPQRTPMPAVDSTLQKQKSVRSFPPTTKFSYVRARAVDEGEKKKHNKDDDDDDNDVIIKRERIIANPILRNKHLIMDTCDANGHLNRRTISKGKMKSFPGVYRDARKSEVGGVWVHPTITTD